MNCCMRLATLTNRHGLIATPTFVSTMATFKAVRQKRDLQSLESLHSIGQSHNFDKYNWNQVNTFNEAYDYGKASMLVSNLYRGLILHARFDHALPKRCLLGERSTDDPTYPGRLRKLGVVHGPWRQTERSGYPKTQGLLWMRVTSASRRRRRHATCTLEVYFQKKSKSMYKTDNTGIAMFRLHQL